MQPSIREAGGGFHLSYKGRTPEASKKRRQPSAAAVADTVATMVIFVPLIVLIVLVTIQASIACVISGKMTQGAHLAARALATQYGTTPSIAVDSTMQQSVLTNVRIQNYVADNGQFEFSNTSWQTTATPPTVTVTCNYIPGVGNPPLAPFPTFDPLGLGKSFKIKATATCRLH